MKHLIQNSFSNNLFNWHETIERFLPWKEGKNVFHIWLSEIILQQTRVEQGIPYFLKFRDSFANVNALAEASDEELMRLWQGLGYYSRARNLHKAAKLIIASGGEFPKTYEGLLDLPGVGPYTAAAIASFAYDLPVPVIDGNVNRVMSRVFGITEGIDTKGGKQLIQKAVDSVFQKESPAKFNQAIMDFGAMHCTPRKPKCETCPFIEQCYAYQNDMISSIPLKLKKVKKVDRVLHYALIHFEEQLLLKKRVGRDIWKHLHDFPEMDGLEETLNYKTKKNVIVDGPYNHVLTHQNLQVYFHRIEAAELILANGSEYFLVDRENLRKFAVPKIIDWYLEEKSIY